jgi:hypothetical protein
MWARGASQEGQRDEDDEAPQDGREGRGEHRQGFCEGRDPPQDFIGCAGLDEAISLYQPT